MILTADNKRRVVLPKPVKAGDALEVTTTGERIVLHILKKAEPTIPPLAQKALKLGAVAQQELDGPVFSPISDESPA